MNSETIIAKYLTSQAASVTGISIGLIIILIVVFKALKKKKLNKNLWKKQMQTVLR